MAFAFQNNKIPEMLLVFIVLMEFHSNTYYSFPLLFVKFKLVQNTWTFPLYPPVLSLSIVLISLLVNEAFFSDKYSTVKATQNGTFLAGCWL